MVGPPAVELDGDDRDRRAAAVLRRPDQPRRCASAGTPTPTGGPPRAGGCSTRSMTFLRRSGSKDSGRAHDPTRPAPTTSSRPAMDLDTFRDVARRVARRQRRRARPRSGRHDHPRRRHGAALEGQAAHLRRRLDAMGMARAGRWAGRLDAVPRLPGGGPDGPGPRRARHLLDDRGAGADDDRLRPPRAGRRRWCRACSAGDETWCQGFSEPGTGSNLAALACRATRTDDGWSVNGQKVWTSLAQYAQRCVLLVRTGTTEDAHRGITALFVDMVHPTVSRHPGSPSGRSRRCTDARSSARSSSTTSWCRSIACSATSARAGRWRWTCCRSSAAPRCGTAARSSTSGSTTCWAPRRPKRSTRERGRDRVPPAVRVPGPLAVDPAPDGRRRQAGPGDVGRQDPARARSSSRSSTSPPTRWPTTCSSATTTTSERWRSEFLYSRAATIYGGSAEIQRNIVARRLLDLGADR